MALSWASKSFFRVRGGCQAARNAKHLLIYGRVWLAQHFLKRSRSLSPHNPANLLNHFYPAKRRDLAVWEGMSFKVLSPASSPAMQQGGSGWHNGSLPPPTF